LSLEDGFSSQISFSRVMSQGRHPAPLRHGPT